MVPCLAGLLYQIGGDVVQYEPPSPVVLQVGITPTAVTNYLRLLQWSHNGAEVVADGRISLSEDNTTLTIVNTSIADSGLYEAKFGGLLVHPYSRNCEQDVLDVLGQYPVLLPAEFHVYSNTSGKLPIYVKFVCVHCVLFTWCFEAT